jgi:hypothetical protein
VAADSILYDRYPTPMIEKARKDLNGKAFDSEDEDDDAAPLTTDQLFKDMESRMKINLGHPPSPALGEAGKFAFNKSPTGINKLPYMQEAAKKSPVGRNKLQFNMQEAAKLGAVPKRLVEEKPAAR